MAIEKLLVDQFRNLSTVSINPGKGLNFIIGPNGSGKTSLLEAIYCLSSGKSFRCSQLNRIITRGMESFSIHARVDDGHLLHKIGFQRSMGQNILRLNGCSANSPVELAQVLPVALIEPGLHQLIEGPPEFRRKFLDWGVFHVEPLFNSVWNRYQRLLKQRNASLRAGWSQKSLNHWDSEFIPIATQLGEYRTSYLNQFQAELGNITQWFNILIKIEFNYQQGWNKDLDFKTALMANYPSDKERGFTQLGPHRADLRIHVGGHPVREGLSRGEQKILATSLILGQGMQLRSKNKSPIILIDDLPAELDANHRRSLLKVLIGTGAQVFITGTDQSLFNEFRKAEVDVEAHVFHVEHGKVKPVELVMAP